MEYLVPYNPLLWLPVWKQLGGVLPDGRPDPEQYNDCGETCVTMVLAAVRGVSLEPGYIRQQLGGTGRSGLTTADDLVQALAINDVESRSNALCCRAAWAALVQAWGNALPVIALGHWLSPTGLHWMLLCGFNGAGFQFIDPWSGSIVTVDWARWSLQSAASQVYVQQHLHFDCRQVEQPGFGAES
jgi:Papain-like cysteine protease AvrRpt2